MGRDHRRRSQTKRRFRQIEGGQEDVLETVDDLAHAAQFAIFPASAVAPISQEEIIGDPMKEEDDNEIEVGGDDDDDDDDDSDSDAVTNDENNEDDNDDSESDDDESDDEDLAEALKQMEQASAEEEAKSATTSNPPKTENEVDGYKVPIQELESQLQIQLTVKGGTETSMATNNEVSLAGRLKNYMLVDRTVVVQSIAYSRPLDEGSLLIVKKSVKDGDGKNASTTSWIPLGRIFEVFGPVSQPLYTIRLPSPPSKIKKTQPHTRSSKDHPKKSEEKIDEQVINDESPTVDNIESNETIAVQKESPLTQENEVTKSVAKNDEPEGSVIDPWAMDGEYAKFLSDNEDIQVYYIQDEAKLIDTGLVLRISGKGCDASNIYDEEIIDPSEAYYSDDEKEREAKNKKKGASRRKKQHGNNGNRFQNNQHRPRNFHQQPGQYQFRQNSTPPPPPPPPQSYPYSQHTGNLPSGFHPQQGGLQQASPLYQYPVQSAFHGQSSIPPPPPPPMSHQQYPHQRAAPSSMPPPPPPPRNPNEPPAYQY